MTQKRRSVDLGTFTKAFQYCAGSDMRFGQLIINALTEATRQSKNDLQSLLWNIENEDLEREINRFIDTHHRDEIA
jgi:hypothetical protein